MATIEEISQYIAEIDNEIMELQKRRHIQKEILRDTMQAAFEAQHMVKPGDRMATTAGTMFYDGFVLDHRDNVYALCHPVKNDGTASKAIRHMSWQDFK